MRLVLSDTALPTGLPVREDWHYVDLSQLKIADCMGCFSCWVRTPGRCVIRDDAVGVYPLIAHSDHVIYVSRLFCGSYDVPMKTMLERAIPIQQAFIRIHHGETHHIQRAVAEKDAVILAYGDTGDEEQALFRLLAADIFDLLAQYSFLRNRVVEVKTEKRLARLQKNLSGENPSIRRMYRRWGFAEDQVVTCYDILEATLRRAHLTPYDPEEAAEDGIGCGRCCALCEDHSCEDDYD